MRAEEIRTGNLILRIGNIHEVDWGTIKICAHRNKQFNEDFKPVQLTDEWLERLGFVGDSILGTQTLYKNNGVEIWVFRNDNTFLVDNIKRKSVYLKYVHQLQNLYFALTGQELKP